VNTSSVAEYAKRKAMTYTGGSVAFFVFAAVFAAFLPKPSSRVSSHIAKCGGIIALNGDGMRAGGVPVGAPTLVGDVAPCLPRIDSTRLATGFTPADFWLPLDTLRVFFVGVDGSSKSSGARRLRGEVPEMSACHSGMTNDSWSSATGKVRCGVAVGTL
jgi:hypothetical protein